MKKLIKKKDKAAIKRNYQSMYERMLNYSKPETQSARGGKSKTTQESGKTCRHGQIQREGTGDPDPPPPGKLQVPICFHRNTSMDPH